MTSERIWRAGRPVDLVRTLGALRHGAGDPVHRFDSSGAFWWAVATPAGDGTVHLRANHGDVHAQAWGAGAQWLLDRVPALLGETDDWTGLDLTSLPKLATLLRQFPGMRLPSSGRVMDSLVPAVLEQRVTGSEAKRSWRQLVLTHGTPAPGPNEAMRLAPTPAALLAVPTWDWHRFGVDLQRQRAIRAAATVAQRLEEIVDLDLAAGERRLRYLPGIGVWTAAETMQRALGHPDLVSVGDFHIANVVVHHLTGQARGTDEQMLELLEPWRGQRQRVVRLIELSGPAGPPKYAPRFAPQDMRAMSFTNPTPPQRRCPPSAASQREGAWKYVDMHLIVDETKAKGYVVVAALGSREDLVVARKELRKLLLPGQRSLHMQAERESRRRLIADTVVRLAQNGVSATVYDAGRRYGTERERRQRCIQALVEDVNVHRQVHITFDRDETLVGFDRRVLIESNRAEGRMSTLTYSHESRSSELLLAIPDAIAWCWARGGDWRRRIEPVVQNIQSI